MVPEHREGGAEAVQEAAQLRLAARPGEQVAGDADEVGAPFGDPVDGACDCDGAARGHAEVEVGEVRDPKAVEIRREPLDRDVEDARPQPAGLEPAVGQPAGGEASEDERASKRRAFRRRA